MRYYSGFEESFYYAYVHGKAGFDHGSPVTTEKLTDCVIKLSDIEATDLAGAGISPVPTSGPGCLTPNTRVKTTYHILVGENVNRYKQEGIVRHGWSGRISPGSLHLIGSGIYMSTPEFTFLQLATVLPLKLMALAGCALCASYYLDPKTEEIKKRDPITTVERIAEFLDGAKGVRGVNTAKNALKLVANGAESPQEVNLYLMMALPPSLGGRGIEGLKLNYLVNPKAEDAGVLDRSDRKFFRIDMGNPDLQKGAEYLGKDHEKTVDEDRERQNALLALGHTVLQAKYADLTDVVKSERLANQLTRILGVEQKELTPSEEQARKDLRDELFGVKRVQL